MNQKLLAIIIFIILLPLLLIICMMIILFDNSNPIFKQTRIGKKGESFKIFKFRTMKGKDNDRLFEKNYERVYKKQRNRITVIGFFLRKTSLDELPQLINIINGTMAFIGPRPLLPLQIKAIPEKYKNRNQVLPGISGIAQVKGRRHLSWLHQLKYDKFYVVHKSFFLNARILFLTIKVIFSTKGLNPKKNKNWREYL